MHLYSVVLYCPIRTKSSGHVRKHRTCEFIFEAACLEVNDVIKQVNPCYLRQTTAPFFFSLILLTVASFTFTCVDDRGFGVALGQRVFSVLATYDYLKKHKNRDCPAALNIYIVFHTLTGKASAETCRADF